MDTVMIVISLFLIIISSLYIIKHFDLVGIWIIILVIGMSVLTYSVIKIRTIDLVAQVSADIESKIESKCGGCK